MMKTLMLSIVALCLGELALAQAPKPPAATSPERQKLAAFDGDWTYVSVVQTTPLGPGYKASGKITGRFVLNGFAMECIYEEKGPGGVTHGRELMWYDAAARRYVYTFHDNSGYVEQGPFVMTLSGTTWEADVVAGDKAYKVRGVETFSPDGRSTRRKAEISKDGKTWLPFSESTLTKARPTGGIAPKSGTR